MGKVMKSIGSAISKVGSFVKKAVSFGAKLLNGPLGKLASFIPGVGPFIAGAAKVLAVADGVLNGKGLSGIVSGLVGGLGGGLLGKAGSLLSNTGLTSLIGLGSKATSTNMLTDLISQFAAPRANNNSAAAQGDLFNLQQFGTFQFAQLLQAQLQGR